VIRVDTETWTAYEQACKDMGTTRADDLRRHIHRQIAAHKRRQKDARDVGAARNIAES
jgi:hypothetical protein